MTSQHDNGATVLPHPDLEGVAFEVGFDNSNPRNGNDMTIDEKGVLIVNQNFEQGAPKGYSFHLNIALLNTSEIPRRTQIRINWQEPKVYDYCRDYMYIGYDSGLEWRMLAIRCNNGITDTEIIIPPGRHLLSCTPKFDTNDYLALLDQYAGLEPFQRVDAAVSAEGRPISCLRCGNPEGETCIITTRAHGYETAGAYCMLGLFEELSSEPANFAKILDRLNLFFFPMINVDAVAHGRCCLAPSGVDFGNELAISADRDRGARELREFILARKPFFYMDMHNYSGPHVSDSFSITDADLFERFTTTAPDHSKQQKVWNTGITGGFKEGYLFSLCGKRYGTITGLTEFPWYTRTVPEMKMHGREFFKAIFTILTKLRTA